MLETIMKTVKLMLATAMAASILAGCGTLTGAAVGGAAGAAIGNNTGDGDAKKGAAIGAAAGDCRHGGRPQLVRGAPPLQGEWPRFGAVRRGGSGGQSKGRRDLSRSRIRF